MSNERISHLEQSVTRWRLVSLVLAVLLLCALAIGATLSAIPSTQEADFWFLPLLRATAAKEAALRAEQQVRVLRAAEAAKRAAEAKADEGVEKKVS
jgi:hypothetical protein